MRIAIVGGGISGLYAAHGLSPDHDVTLYEANGYLGGHTDTHHIKTGGSVATVDTGFIVFNEHNYPLFSRFIEQLGVGSRPSDMSFSVSDRIAGMEYNATNVSGLLCDPRNLLRPGFYRMLADILRFYRNAPRLLETGSDELTIGEYLEAEGYSDDFLDSHIVPMASALWSSPPETVVRFPARYFVGFMHNHSMLQVTNRPLWRTVKGGSSSYVAAFEARFEGTVRKHTPVTRVSKSARGVTVSTPVDSEIFDAVVMACHSDQSLRILDQRMVEQRSALADIPYQRNEIILHSDASVMPANPRAWASWNVVRHPPEDGGYIVSYWMNMLQGIRHATPLLVSLNAGRKVDSSKELLRREYDHPVYTPASLRASRTLAELSGRDDVYFAGAYLGWGFHEDGARSAQRVVESINQQRMYHAA